MDNSIGTASFTRLHWGTVVLAAVTGVIHLAIGVSSIASFGFEPLAVALALAGLGFFGGILLFLRDVRRRQLYVAGILFTALQIVLWVQFNQLGGDPAISPVEIIDKLVQVLLIAVLGLLYRQP
ncbi:MAG: hypothetical protein V5A38_00675 [Halolamina sp.]|uniref:DUF7475 family protein n=1 Tax=Halolamina sp. TaxID=1940283 RepID=UPI002FC3B6C6